LIDGAASYYGVPSKLVSAVIGAESGGNARATSPTNAQGLMQLEPGTAREMGVRDPYDPRQNVYGGVRYLATLLRRYGGNVALALAAYNAGPGAVEKYGGIPPYPETQNYVRHVMASFVGI
jgi:soluble lytic murein transglycosylase-like protein